VSKNEYRDRSNPGCRIAGSVGPEMPFTSSVTQKSRRDVSRGGALIARQRGHWLSRSFDLVFPAVRSTI